MNSSIFARGGINDSVLNSTDYPTGLDDGVPEFYILDQYSVRLTFAILYSIVFFLCFFGNSVVLLVVTTHWRMKHITKFCLANLAVADFCVGVFCVYQNLSTYFIDDWMLGEFLCKMYQFINGISHTASVLTLVAVCVERYLAILQPLRCKRILTKTRLKIIVVAVWLVSGLYCSPRLYYMSLVAVPRSWDGPEMEMETICTARRNLYNSRTFDLINSLFLFILPLVLMTVLYTRVGLVLWSSGENTLPFSVPAIMRTFPSNDRLTQSETCGINPRDRVIEIKLGKKSERRHPPDTINHNRRVSSKDSSLFRSQSSPDLTVGGNSFPCYDFNNDTPRSSNAKVLSESKLESFHKMDIIGKKQNLISFQSGLNALRRKHFLKKIQARKELQLQKHFLGGGSELKLRRSVVKMLMVIVGAFAVCNFPFHVRKFAIYWWPSFDYASTWGTLSLPVSYLCMYANCAINPIIYAFMSASFRASIKDVIHGRWKKPNYNAVYSAPRNNTLVSSPSTRSNFRILRAIGNPQGV